MLKFVHLKNLALIREAEIDFSSGLNILTGETGAGKSIILGSINIALGDKAQKSFIRTGADYGLVELTFSNVPDKVLSLLDEYGISRDEKNITITRKITQDLSFAKINGETVNLSALKSITSYLVDIHGQHEHQSLLNQENHLKIIDEFAGKECAETKEKFRREYTNFKDLKKKYSEYSMDPESLKKEMEFLRFECDEIEKADLKEKEDENLEEEYKKLSASDKVLDGALKAFSLVGDEQAGALSKISDALKETEYLCTIDSSVKDLKELFMDAESVVRDAVRELNSYINANKFDEERYKFVSERLNEINRLKAKYGSTIPEIFNYRDEILSKLEKFTDYNKNRSLLEDKMRLSREKINMLANELSEQRKKSAEMLEPLIIQNLKDLNFLNAEFKIDFSKTDRIYETGFDKVEFMLSANPGEPLKPLASVASGGELSRICLAIKSSIAAAETIDTLIFDEIDSGISGKTAQKVAEKLAFLGKKHQIICITHLPQIAAMGDVHFSIEKNVEDGSTVSGIKRLGDRESLNETARLLSGAEITPNTLFNADELRREARKFKNSI